MDIDTRNDQLVGVQGDRVVVMMPNKSMTGDQARRHAAWLVALADVCSESDSAFADVLEAVRNT